MLNAISIILRGRQDTLESGVWYSKRSVISLIVVLLYFLKYRRSVLFPSIVVSAFVGLVLYLCHDLICRITGSKFWYFCSNCSLIFSVGGRKTFSTPNFDKGIWSNGSWRSKTWFIVYFESFIGGPDKFILSVKFSFSINGKVFFLCGCCLIVFCWVFFLIQCE